ncbi:MAG: hypothetical protein KTR30_31600 [Saprospiraceae bacterium]|nr:hypothetical protein [Saprospiraceae bacterium]
MFWRKFLSKLSGGKVNFLAYVLEIFLIIFSILIAIQADRYQQSKRNQHKLDDYIKAMYLDLLDEQESNRNNLYDCQQDIKSIRAGIRLSQNNQNDSIQLALYNLAQVASRAVFRAFPPTTFDIMMSTGDIALIKDLGVRSQLASTFSFRDAYVKRDLLEFDNETQKVTRELSKYANLSCMYATRNLTSCLTDLEGFTKHFHNELFPLSRTAGLREFHLKRAITYFNAAIENMEEVYGLKREDVIKEAEASE